MTTTLPSFSAEQFDELVALLPDANTVELKLTVPDTDRAATLAALGIDPLDAQIRQVFFFDTPTLHLNRNGLVVRARRIQGRPSDSVVKLRPVVPSELAAEFRAAPTLGIEIDAMPGGFVCSASMKGALGTTEVREVAQGNRTVKKLFSKEQRSFFADHAPEGVGFANLAILGPITVFKVKFAPKGLKGRRIVAELWNYPDNTRILELSTKCLPADAFDVAAESRAFLTKRGIDLDGEQQTKTSTALTYFSQLLTQAPEPVAPPG